MHRDDASDLLAFLAVARERNFTRAAAKLGMTQSALSQIIRNLEERLGVRLLNRTTRSVTPTQAGERLFQSIGPKFTEMDNDLAALGEFREKPAGTVRLTATEYAASEILLPALGKLLPKYPTSMSRSSSTTGSPTSSRSRSMRASVPASLSPRT
ncbi:DNA-binding transcriptional LysR family regulator [Bradyrhizobium sp. SBR1B]|nr:DNA-binding transcriptional LysR family regulator [Bradyrhizobium sp. SBR1B]